MKLYNRIIVWIMSVAVGGLFIYAGWAKSFGPQAFADSIASFKILPAGLIVPAALSIPPFEILAGLLAVTGWHRRVGLLAIAVATAAYCVAIGSALVRGLDVNCGCFGPVSNLRPGTELLRDLLVLAFCVASYVLALSGLSSSAGSDLLDSSSSS